MKQRQKGFILLPVLVFFQVFSVIGLHDLFTAFIWRKTNVKLWQHHLNKNALDNILQQIEAKLAYRAPACMIKIHDPIWIIHQANPWWEQYACSGNFAQIRYHYVVELWDVDPCGAVKNDHDQVLAASYYRITLFATEEAPKGAKSFRQSIFVKGEQTAMRCKDRFHQVLSGRQMCRHLH